MAVQNLQTWQPQIGLSLWLMLVGSLLPSGKRLNNYGKSPCLMGKSTISSGHFQWLL